MLFKFAHLELTKHWKEFLSTLFVMIVGVLGVGAGSAFLRHMNLRDAITGAAAFLVCGLPLLAALFGIQFGMGLRRDAERSHEEVLPVHPVVKVFGSYLASLIYFAAIGCLVLQLLAFQSVNRVVDSWQPQAALNLASVILALLQIHFLAFAFSYWWKLPLLSGGIAVIAVVLDLYFRSLVWMIYVTGYEMDGSASSVSRFIPYLGIFIFLIWIAGAFALSGLARCIERNMRTRPVRSLLFGVGLLCGPIFWALALKLILGSNSLTLTQFLWNP